MWGAEPAPPVSSAGASRGAQGGQTTGSMGAGHRMGSRLLGNVPLSGLGFLLIKMRGPDFPACIQVSLE